MQKRDAVILNNSGWMFFSDMRLSDAEIRDALPNVYFKNYMRINR